jgi:hypothetical protein
MEQKKNTDLGAGWIKSGNFGDYISFQVEIDGVKHNFTAFPNKYKKEGSNQPDYRIPAPKTPAQPTQVVDKYQRQLDNVMAQKAAREKIKALPKSVGDMMEEAGLLTEKTFTEDFGDVPF